jgi:hypothetical protein
MKSESLLSKIAKTSALVSKPHRAVPKRRGRPRKIRSRHSAEELRRLFPGPERRPELLAAMRALFTSDRWLRREEIYAAIGVPDRYDATTVANVLASLVWRGEAAARETGETYLMGRKRVAYGRGPRHAAGIDRRSPRWRP